MSQPPANPPEPDGRDAVMDQVEQRRQQAERNARRPPHEWVDEFLATLFDETTPEHLVEETRRGGQIVPGPGVGRGRSQWHMELHGILGARSAPADLSDVRVVTRLLTAVHGPAAVRW